MNRATWKNAERRVAKRLGGIRKPVSGREQHEADVETPVFMIQVKHGRNRPSYLADWLGGIRATAQAKGKTGFVVWSRMHEDSGDALVVMTLGDFEALCGKVLRSAEDAGLAG